jgi:hypothetical protein
VTTKEQHKWFGDVRVGERIAIDGGTIVLRLEEKSGKSARLRLEFTRPITVERVEPAMAAFARQGVK